MGLHVTGQLKVSTGIRLTGERDVEGDLDLRTAEVKDLPEGARVIGTVLTEREASQVGSIYTVGYGQVVFRPLRGNHRVIDEIDQCDAIDFASARVEARVTRRQRYTIRSNVERTE